jgi:hypothetical protein
LLFALQPDHTRSIPLSRARAALREMAAAPLPAATAEQPAE